MRTEARWLEELAGHSYCELTTFRRSGVGVPTPVWFAVAGRRVVVRTESPSGKVRRLRRDARVRVAPCTLMGRVVGASRPGRARILDGPEAEAAERVLAARFGLLRRVFYVVTAPVFHRRGQRPLWLEIVPAAEEEG